MNLDFSYTPPDFDQPHLKNSPLATLEPSPADGIAPANYHATSNHPEYIKIGTNLWVLAPESRMDAVFVVTGERIEVVEARHAGTPLDKTPACTFEATDMVNGLMRMFS